jgi:TPR repeat protein
MKRSPELLTDLPRFALAAGLCISLIGCKMSNDFVKMYPRTQDLPLFTPYVSTFACEVESTKVPAIDAQAEAWFLEARALEGPETIEEARDYKKIVNLTRQAAERRHWKAMLNLASLYLENRDSAHGIEDAVQIVEQAMLLGIPAAFDRMGTYHLNGTGVAPDATRAYAFWQKAAGMGNPHAMAFLAEKLDVGPASAGAGHWSNIPMAIKMLECAFGQGYGPAAFDLHYLYASPRDPNGKIIGGRTMATKARALMVLHEGVKLGCIKCANKLEIEFAAPYDLSNMLAPHVDKARGERYSVLNNELGFNPDARFPNLDKVLPLPPADLPPWNGDRDTLLEAAMGVSLKRPPPPPTAASQYTDRRFLDAAFKLRPTGDKTVEQQAPMSGYWQPIAPEQAEPIPAMLACVAPGLYRAGEAFDGFMSPAKEDRNPISGVVWERSETIRYNHGAMDPLAATGLTREVPCPDVPVACGGEQACPASGIWQPWVDVEHPMRAIVNQHWRQSWMIKAQAFPHPERDWLLALPVADVTWYLIDPAGVEIG